MGIMRRLFKSAMLKEMHEVLLIYLENRVKHMKHFASLSPAEYENYSVILKNMDKVLDHIEDEIEKTRLEITFEEGEVATK